LTLSEAKRRVWACRLLGAIIVAFAFLAAMLLLLKYLYSLRPTDSVFDDPLYIIQNFVYQIIVSSSTLYAIWSLIPLVKGQLLNFLIMSVLVWMVVGFLVVKYAGNLNGRIRRVRHTVEEERWRQSLGQEASTGDILSIQMESEERWYAKPKGLLIIGIIIEVVGGLLLLLVGPLLSSPR
jgi:hypothetical protein